MLTKKKIIAALIAIFVVFELSLYFAVNDYKIWITIGNLESKTGLAMQILGEVAAPFIAIACGAIIAMYFWEEKDSPLRFIKIAFGALFVIGGLGYCFHLYVSFDNFILMPVLFIVTGALFAWLVIMLKKSEHGRMFQLLCIAVTALVYCISVMVIILIIKVLWGRVRPRDLKSLSDFSVWYIPQGINGNNSFPSGHTANATTLYAITMLVPLVKNKIGKVLLYVGPAIWIVFMAYSRVLIGAHYCSDTLFGAAISIAIFYLSKKYTLRFIEKRLS